MQYKTERALLESKVDYDNITIPNNIDEYIQRGIKKYPSYKRIGLRLRTPSIAAAIILFLLISMIRISPVFADYLEDVPILKYIVKLVHYDKGLKSSVENKFIQTIGVSDEHEGIKFTIDNIIVDAARMVVFYTIENNSQYKYLEMSNVKFTDETGKSIEAGYGFGISYDKQELRKIQDNLKVSFVESTIIPETIHLQVEFHQKDTPMNYVVNPNRIKLPYTWQIDIPVDKNKFANMKEVYDINQTVEIENQKIIIEKAIINPTRIEVQLAFPEENSKKILRFEDIKIVDEKGEEFATITEDVSATMPDDNHINLYFESNYFSKPKELYLQLGSLRALDKDKLDVVIDTDKKQILKGPDDRLSLDNITFVNGETMLQFLLNTDGVMADDSNYFIFATGIKDKNNIEYNASIGSVVNSDTSNNQRLFVTLPGIMKFTSPINLTIVDYPSRIIGDLKIKLK